MAGVNLLHVPYKGSAPAPPGILAGQVDMMFDNIPGPLGLMKGGKVKGFAVTSKDRHPAAPDKPTFAGIPAGLRDHLLGRRLRTGRRAAGNGRGSCRP